jgi:hypothetical protein
MCLLCTITNLTTQVSKKTYLSPAFLSFSSIPLGKHFANVSVSVHASNFHVFRVQFFSIFRTILLSSVCLSVRPFVFLFHLSSSLVVEPRVQHSINHDLVLSSPVCKTYLLEGRGGLSIRLHCSPYRRATPATGSFFFLSLQALQFHCVEILCLLGHPVTAAVLETLM